MRKFGWLGVLLVVLAGAACGPTTGDDTKSSGSSDDKTSSSSKPDDSGDAAATADPPLKFEGEPVPFKPSVVTEVAPKARESFATLRDNTAYIVGGKGIGAYDLPTGKELWKAPGPEYVSGLPLEDNLLPSWPSGPLSPALSEDGKTVAAAFPYYTEAGEYVTVMVADANSGKVELKTDIMLPISYKDNWNGDTTTVYAKVLAVTDKSVIFTAGLSWEVNNTKYTYSIDRDTKKTVWKKVGFGATGLSGSQVIGTFKTEDDLLFHVQALDAETGKPTWDTPQTLGVYTEQPAAGTVFVTYSKTSKSGGMYFLDAANGKPKGAETIASAIPATGPFLRCTFDQKATLICLRFDLSGDTGKTWITAYDAATGKQLWQQKKQGGADDPTAAAWHGAVYLDSGSGDTNILDARTGKQKASFPDQVPPDYVNSYGGLRLEEDFSMTFLPVAG
ncbi:outer membrane protein assembly factor BamB family protein [Flindersiella endophytica]